MPPGKTYVYCADTKYDESIIPYIQNADMIYHETTYLDALKDRASERFHSTSKEAALIAKKGNVKKLLIGHFSSKYDSLEEFEKEAREIFLDTELALEGVTYRVSIADKEVSMLNTQRSMSMFNYMPFRIEN